MQLTHLRIRIHHIYIHIYGLTRAIRTVQMGAKVLIMDEDTCATNFMIRDQYVGCHMVRVIPHAVRLLSYRSGFGALPEFTTG